MSAGPVVVSVVCKRNWLGRWLSGEKNFSRLVGLCQLGLSEPDISGLKIQVMCVVRVASVRLSSNLVDGDAIS